MNKWHRGKETYEKLVDNIGAWVTSECDDESAVIRKAKNIVPEFVSGLRVLDLVDIHEYLMYITEMRPDIRTPAYVYSGGDRIISVTRYLLKNIDLELAKQYA